MFSTADPHRIVSPVEDIANSTFAQCKPRLYTCQGHLARLPQSPLDVNGNGTRDELAN